MKKRYLLILILVLFTDCKLNFLEKEPSDSPLMELGLLAIRGNRQIISGTAVKGVIRNGLVTVSHLQADGSCGANPIEVTTTDTQGNYSITYQRIGAPICLVVGPRPDGTSTLFDEKSAKDIPIPASAKFRLTTIYPESKITENRKSFFTISPFSRMLSKRIQFLMKQKGESDVAKLHTRASRELVIRFGLNKGLGASTGKSLTQDVGKNLSINDPGVNDMEDILIELQKPDSPLTLKFVSILMGFSHLANKHKSSSEFSIDDLEAIMDALARDFADGSFDGKDESGSAITIGQGATQITFPADVLKDLILPAVAAYFQEGGSVNVGNGPLNVSINSTQIQTEIQFVGTAPIAVDGQTTGGGAQYTIGGTISGLTGTGLVLLNNGGDSLSVPSGATSFTFATSVNSGTAYNVTVSGTPSGLACTVTNGTGTANANVSNINISCALGKTIGGSISGLNAAGLVLQLNGTNYSINSGATTYTFPFAIATGATYTVGIGQQPTGLACSVSNPTGTASANVTNANVVCVGSGVFSIQVTWSRAGDLDLAVGTPNNAYISHGGSADGGTQDRDAADMGPENVFWTNTPPTGTYYICLDSHSFSPVISGTDPVNYTITVRKNGSITNTFTGSMSAAVSASTCISSSTHKVAEVAWP